MNQVQGFQVFTQLPVNHVVAAFQPGKGGHVVAGRGSSAGRVVEVDQDVVIGDQFVQRRQDVPVSMLFCFPNNETINMTPRQKEKRVMLT